jgi:nitroreductase
MDFTDVIQTRRSHRKFTDEKVPKAVLRRIMDAAFLAPSWSNKQGVRYIIVDDKDQLKKLSEAGQKWIAGAPMAIVGYIDPKNSGVNLNGLEYFPVDVAISLHQLILAATNEGLGTCWIGFFDEEKTKKVLKLPEEMRVVGMTPLGYSRYLPRSIERQTFENSVFHNEYGSK